MLYIRDIEKIIEDTLQEHNITIDYEFNNTLPAPMSFNISTNMLKFNYLKINGYIANINFKIKETDEDCVKLILYLQLGYHLALKNNKHDLRVLKYFKDDEKAEFLAKIESNAWDFGRTLVPEKLVPSYDKVRELDKELLKSY
ncbi:hypothetical protein ACE198_13820 [Neobacillus sp. KR4-4]|uniref:hypothetical protein n=1 Tax=Neobacillus sp. KR4-4 TaxID=3344872 RepID=UPI0035CB2E1D